MKRWAGILVVAAGLAPEAHSEPLHAPQNVAAEPGSVRSSQMSTEAAQAEMKGDAQSALRYATEGIAADSRDPWPYYDKAEALARLGQTDAAVEAFTQAQQRFAATDRWGQSVAIFGRAHALDQAKRCKEARAAFDEYATLIKDQDPQGAQMAQRYAADCEAGASSTAR